MVAAAPAAAARRLLEQARAEFASLGEAWRVYPLDVELLASLVCDLGVQRVPGLSAGGRPYAGLLLGEARLIAVEAGHHPHRQRFTVAHEVGHFVLHFQPAPHPGANFACSETDMLVPTDPGRAGAGEHRRREAEANAFAAELLMPAAAVQALYRAAGRQVAKLARHFDVSVQAMALRLDDLGLPHRAAAGRWG